MFCIKSNGTCSKFFDFAHVLFGKPVPTFPEHALARGPGRFPALAVMASRRLQCGVLKIPLSLQVDAYVCK